MDQRIGRFKLCDPQLYPYLDRVFSRLPESLRDDFLNDEGFQVLADPQLSNICGRNYYFDHPVNRLIYLNTDILMQPDHRLLCSIAWELAEHAAKEEGQEGDDRKIEELLISWGFEREYNSVCFCDAISGSRAFKSGYEWAKGQGADYLMLHFGLYFDEWNEKGLTSMPGDRLEQLRSAVSQERLLPGPIREEKELPGGVSIDEVLIEGIMAGLKEIKGQIDSLSA